MFKCKIRNSFFTILLISCFVQTLVESKKAANKIPSFVKICHRNDPQLNSCARSSLLALQESKRLNAGIPELFVPPIEPMVIPEVKLDQNSGAIYLHSTFKNIKLSGLSNFNLKELNIDPVKIKLSLTATFPNISINADYVMKGKIMMMPLVGEGACSANFSDVEINALIIADRYRKHEGTFIKLRNIKINYTLGKTALHLENLFNGDPTLGKRMNVFINENWDSLSEEVRPLIEKTMAEVIRSTTEKIFDAYSFDDLLPK